MPSHQSLPLVRIALAVVAAGLLLNQGGNAARKELAKQVEALADALRKGNMDAVPDLVKKAAKLDHEMEHYMQLFRSRKQQGFGVGKVPGAITPDSIEGLVQHLAKNEMTKEEMKKDAEALIELGYRTAALAKITESFAPKKDKDKKTKARWFTYSGSMYEGGMDLVLAVQSGSVGEARKAAIRINGNCNSCHTIFKKHH